MIIFHVYRVPAVSKQQTEIVFLLLAELRNTNKQKTISTLYQKFMCLIFVEMRSLN